MGNLFRGGLIIENGIQKLDLGKIKVEIVPRPEFESVKGFLFATIRPEDILLSIEPFHSSARNSFPGWIVNLQDRGGIIWVTMEPLSGFPYSKAELASTPFVAVITKRSQEEMGLKVGMQVYFTFKASCVNVFK